MKQLLLIGGAIGVAYFAGGKTFAQKLLAAKDLSFDVIKFVFTGLSGSSSEFEMTVEVANHSDTPIVVQDIILDIKMPNGVTAAKIDKKLNKKIDPRSRTTAKLKVKVSTVKASASVSRSLLKMFAGSSDKLFEKPVRIKGSIKAEGFSIPIDQKVGAELERG